MITFATGCSGIGAPEVALGDRLGWKCLWHSEIEPFPSEVLKARWPGVLNVGDFMKIAGCINSDELEAPDVFIAGTPCQAFSIAGLRDSLTDERGGLTLEYCRIATAMDGQRRKRGLPETIFIWENVPGVLNTKDNAFGCFLAGLSGETEPLEPAERWTNAGAVYGQTRSLAWRILDAQYFGVAQRRRRVFVIGTARTGLSPARALFEFGSVPRNIAPSREKRKEVAGGTGESTDRAGCFQQNAREEVNFVGGGSNNISLALLAGTGTKFQGLIHQPRRYVAAFMARQGAKAGSVAYQKEISPTFKTCEVPSVLCVHGSQDPICSTEKAHPVQLNNGLENVICYENHANDSRITEVAVAPTLSSRAGTGGGNLPLVMNNNKPITYDVDSQNITESVEQIGTIRARDYKGGGKW